MLLANGANIVAMQSYDNLRGYFENALADSITNRKKFRSGLSIHDISKPGEMREIAFLEMPGLRRQPAVVDRRPLRLLCRRTSTATPITSCASSICRTSPSRRSCRAGGCPACTAPAARRPTLAAGQARGAAPHDRRRQPRLRRVARRRLHDPRRERSGAAEAAVAHQLVAALPRRHAHAAAAAGTQLAVVADEANAERCAKGTFHTFVVDVRVPENPVPIATLPTPSGRDFCGLGTFGPHNLHENRPNGLQSETTIFATYNNAGVRVFDIGRPVRAEGDRVLGAAGAREADRPAAERRARGQERRPVRDDGWADVRERLERRPATCWSIADEGGDMKARWSALLMR